MEVEEASTEVELASAIADEVDDSEVVELESVTEEVVVDAGSVMLEEESRLVEVGSTEVSEDVEVKIEQGGPSMATTETSSTLYITAPDPSVFDILIATLWRSPLTVSWDLTSK